MSGLARATGATEIVEKEPYAVEYIAKDEKKKVICVERRMETILRIPLKG